MGSGTGNSFLDSAIDYGSNIFSAGTVGFGEEGFGKGVFAKEGRDTSLKPIKDVTGATAAEEANADARARFEEEKAKAEEQRKQNTAQSAADQLAASRSAASARGGVSSPSGNQSRFSNLGSDEEDFLGL